MLPGTSSCKTIDCVLTFRRWYNELVSRPSWLACKDEVKTTLEY